MFSLEDIEKIINKYGGKLIKKWPSLSIWGKSITFFTAIHSVINIVGFTLDHYEKIIVISPESAKTELIYVEPTHALISIGINIIFFFASVVCIYLSKPLDGPSSPTQKKYKVHAVLPTGPEGNTMGDGLLQAAGFLAAEKQFQNDVEITYHDHQNNNGEAVKIVKEIFNNASSEEPICIIFTMSNICNAVVQKTNEILRESPELENRTSIIFTVASSPSIKANGKVFFQHFVGGNKEATVIIQRCDAIKSDRNIAGLETLLLVTDSTYPEETAEIISNNLLNRNFKPSKVLFNHMGDIIGADITTIIEDIKQADPNKLIVIAIAYDKALLRAIELLKSARFKGTFISTTTLSVKDWQNYITSKNALLDYELNAYYTQLSHFDINNGGGRVFSQALHEWTFEEVIGQEKIYGKGVKAIRKSFDSTEQEVFKEILPNYISAFCFDTIGLFAFMSKYKKNCIAEIWGSICSEDAYLTHSPFSGITLSGDGKSHLDLEITKMVFKEETANPKEVFIVVDVQQDFCTGGALEVDGTDILVSPLNKAIKQAHARGMLIIYTRDWHPVDHSSFDKFGGKWPKHCIQNTPGAKLHPELHISPDSKIIDVGTKKDTLGYSPFEEKEIEEFLEEHEISKVYVAGVALQFCVRATCVDAKKHVKTVVALEHLICAIENDPLKPETVWAELEDKGIIRSDKFDPL